jgi:dTDP-4-dehydrorhamnose 3,5-epimerase
MQVTSSNIEGLLLIEPKVFGDDRGFFYESYNQKVFQEITGLDVTFVQDNHSRSMRGVLRGLHYQMPPAAQGKLVRCISGEVFDVAVDIRRKSPTYGQWYGCNLSAENRCQLWIPTGFAHGFLVLSESAEFLYKTTDYYTPAAERCISWNDPDIGVAWPLAEPPVLSGKDQLGVSFANAEIPF